MYISRIYVHNFRNFHELDVQLGPTNVIVGENKIGKTNLITALRILLDPSYPDIKRSLHAEDFWDGLEQPFNEETIEISIEISGFDEDELAESLLTDFLIQADPNLARVTYIFRPRTRISPGDNNDYEYIIFGGPDETKRLPYNWRQWLSLIILPALRNAERDILSWRRSPLRPLLERLEIDEARLNEIIENLNAANENFLEEESVQDLSTNISERLEEIIGKVHGSEVNLGFVASNPEQLLRSIRLFVDGEKARPIHQASLGTANVLFLVLLMEELSKKREHQETINTILGIEEPEAHIHPHIQRLVFKYLLRQELPTFITTHSPHIASVSPIEDLIVLKGSPGEGTKAFSCKNLDITSHQKDDLERYLDVTRAEILFAKGTILVEGISELYLIPVFAHAMGINFDQYGISVCSVHGTDFVPYWKMLSEEGFNTPRVIITDGDPQDSNGEIILAGIERGARIASLSEIIIENNNPDAKEALNDFGIFVGLNTLELDLTDTYAEKMIIAYAELVESELKTERFRGAITDYLNNNENSGTEIINRINAIGKGRYAQRLSTHIENEEPPDYIRDAIYRIVSLVDQVNESTTT